MSGGNMIFGKAYDPMTQHDELAAERDAVRLSFAYRLDEFNRKASPITTEQLIEREVRKFAEQDAALDALIAKAKLVGAITELEQVKSEAYCREITSCSYAGRLYGRLKEVRAALAASEVKA